MDALKRVRQLMEERNWTEYRLAKEAKLSNSTINNMFSRNNAPTIPTLECLCRAFGITLAQFFTEEEQLPKQNDDLSILFDKWSKLTDGQKKALLDLIDHM